MKLVKRGEIPEMNTIFVDGKEHDLGVLKHWRKSPLLNRVLPRSMDVSLAWVRLEKDQVLDIHVHPVDSMVVCCAGQVRSIGDRELELDEGDIIVLPTGCRHGFVGAGERGFWGISIQFESLALYEDLDSPLVTFIEPEHARSEHIDAVTLLLQKNEHHLQKFRNHRVFELLEQGWFEQEPARWTRFCRLLQRWSECFQRLLLCRAAFTESTKFAALARAHLDDEFGHDRQLGGSDEMQTWDPILEATAQWFVGRMLTLDDAEKTVLVHLVLESAGAVFYERFARLARRTSTTGEHFESHVDEGGSADVAHVKMGLEMLRRVPLAEHAPLVEIQQRGWQMFTTMFDRMMELARA